MTEVAKSEVTDGTPPIPNKDILGDALYANMVSLVTDPEYSGVTQPLVTEYSYYVPAGTKDFLDIENNDALKTECSSGNKAAIEMDKLLTKLFNGLVKAKTGSDLYIDSLAEDFAELHGAITKGRIKDLSIEDLSSIMGRLNSICNESTITHNEETSITSVALNEVCVVLSEDVSIKEPRNGYLTDESAPALTSALYTIENSESSIVYLLTDTQKYMLCYNDECTKVVLVSM